MQNFSQRFFYCISLCSVSSQGSHLFLSGYGSGDRRCKHSAPCLTPHHNTTARLTHLGVSILANLRREDAPQESTWDFASGYQDRPGWQLDNESARSKLVELAGFLSTGDE